MCFSLIAPCPYSPINQKQTIISPVEARAMSSTAKRQLWLFDCGPVWRTTGAKTNTQTKNAHSTIFVDVNGFFLCSKISILRLFSCVSGGGQHRTFKRDLMQEQHRLYGRTTCRLSHPSGGDCTRQLVEAACEAILLLGNHSTKHSAVIRCIR